MSIHEHFESTRRTGEWSEVPPPAMLADLVRSILGPTKRTSTSGRTRYCQECGKQVSVNEGRRMHATQNWTCYICLPRINKSRSEK